jgi:hypothetical protein
MKFACFACLSRSKKIQNIVKRTEFEEIETHPTANQSNQHDIITPSHSPPPLPLDYVFLRLSVGLYLDNTSGISYG